MFKRQPIPYLVRNLLRAGGYELVPVRPSPSLLALHVHRLFREFQIELVLDVGARVGDYGIWLRRNGYRGRIISFEPVAESFARLEKASSNDPLWTVRNVALGERQTTSKINVTEFSVFSSFLRPNKYSAAEYGSQSTVRSTEDVRVEKLDDCWAQLVGNEKPNTYLKMDTQGWDLQVLRGAESCLADIVALQSELSAQLYYDGMPSMDESLTTLEKLGYSLSGLFPVNLDRALRVIDFDCVAIRA